MRAISPSDHSLSLTHKIPVHIFPQWIIKWTSYTMISHRNAMRTCICNPVALKLFFVYALWWSGGKLPNCSGAIFNQVQLENGGRPQAAGAERQQQQLPSCSSWILQLLSSNRGQKDAYYATFLGPPKLTLGGYCGKNHLKDSCCYKP